MHIDNQLVLATAHAPTSQSTVIGTNVYDMGPLATGNTGFDLGAGEKLELEILVATTATTGGGSATVDFKFYSHSTTTITSGTLHASTGPIGYATLVAGYRIRITLPRATYAQYIGVATTIATADLTGGAFGYRIVKTVDDRKNYAAAYVVA